MTDYLANPKNVNYVLGLHFNPCYSGVEQNFVVSRFILLPKFFLFL